MQWNDQDTRCQWLCVGLLVSSRISATVVVFSLTGTTFRAASLHPVCYSTEKKIIQEIRGFLFAVIFIQLAGSHLTK